MPLFVTCHPDGCYLSSEPESDRAVEVDLGHPKSEEVIRHLLALDSFVTAEALGRLAMACLTMAGSAGRRPLPMPDHVVPSP